MKLSLNALAILAVAKFAQADGTDPKPEPTCNPALQCPGISIECMPCNPRLDDNCDISTMDDGRRGVCVEPAPLDYVGKVYGMQYEERCRRVVDPDWANAKPKPVAEDYIKSCREGFYTCNDGTCEIAKNFPKACYEGIFDSNLYKPGEKPCNIAEFEPLQDVLQFWDALDHDSYCKKAGGVRYGPLRCDRDAIISSADNCGPGQEPKPETCTNGGEVISLVGPADACTATCDGFNDLFQKPGCCIDEPGRVCSDFIVYSPSEDIARCDDKDLENEGCSVCEGPSSVEYPFCCMEGSEPVCVNFLGLDKEGERTKCSDGKPSEGIKGDVCYVNTAGSTATPPAISDTGFGAEGVELTFQFQKPHETDGENDCCCDMVCSCFGDPHCTSFYGDYEVSQDEEGTYVMVDEGGVFIEGELGEPLGITEVYNIKVGKTLIEIRDKECVYGEGIFLDGSDTPTTDLKDYDFIQYERGDETRPNDKDKKPWEKNKKLSKHLAINPTLVKIEHGQYNIEVRCLHFEMTRGPDKGWHNRLDITVKRGVDEVQAEPGCCPSNENVFLKLGLDSKSGFCFRHPTEPGSSLPNVVDLTAKRRLSEEQERALVGARKLSTMTCDEICSHDNIGMDEYQCMELCYENGVEAMKNLLKMIEDSCKSFASDEVFDYDAATANCEEGLILEAKLPTQSKWTPIKFFPKSVVYCDNKIQVLYEHTKVGKKTLNQNYELRLRSCTPEAKCGSMGRNICEPYGGINNLGVTRYLYGSTYAESLLEFVKRAARDCACEAKPLQCVELCVFTGSCPPKDNCD